MDYLLRSHEEAKQTIARGDGVARLSIDRMAAFGYTLSRDDDSHGSISGLPEYQDPPSDDHLNQTTSVITPKPARHDHFKTGQPKGLRTTSL
jgi:hypothetical protein